MKTLTVFLLLICSMAVGQNENLSPTSNFNGEPYLAINPTNPKNIVIAWMHVSLSTRPIRTRSSFDGGLTWSNPVDLPIVNTNTADPTMAFDNAGNLYLCFIDHLGTSVVPNNGGIYSYKSTDGGLTWGNQVLVIDIDADGLHQPIDRPWLVCDRSGGVNDGTLYLTSKVVSGGPAPYHPYFLKSTDGANSWSNWSYMDTSPWLSNISSTFAAPTVNASGKFTAVYPSFLSSQHPVPRYVMATYDNMSNSFSYKASINNMPTASNDSAKRAWQFIANPINENHLVFLYISGVNGDLDILMTETYNYGDTWSASIRINDDPISNGVLQDLVWASFDNDSDLVVCWRDRRSSGGTGFSQASEIYGAVRWKDSTDFSSNFKISDNPTPYNTILSQSGNDFMCQQMHQDTLYVTWGDTRTGFLNIWFDKIALNSGATLGDVSIANSELPFIQLFPNPTNSEVSISIDENKLRNVFVFDGLGEKVKTFQSNKFTVHDLLPGIYFIVAETESDTYNFKLIVN